MCVHVGYKYYFSSADYYLAQGYRMAREAWTGAQKVLTKKDGEYFRTNGKQKARKYVLTEDDKKANDWVKVE